MSTTKK